MADEATQTKTTRTIRERMPHPGGRAMAQVPHVRIRKLEKDEKPPEGAEFLPDTTVCHDWKPEELVDA